MRTAVFVAVAALAAALFMKRGIAWSFDEGEHESARMGMIDAMGARQVRVESAAGDLRVVGVNGLDKVRVHGTAHASRSGALHGIKLDLRREGDRVVVRALLPRQAKRWFGKPATTALDMEIEVPASMEADVVDGSGDAEVQGVSALRMTDASGDVRIVDVRGPVRLTDASGEAEAVGVMGDLWVEDGSGALSIRDVAGSLVASDGSGELNAAHVQGDVLVRRDGSGDIDVSDVAGRLIVQQDGSGEVRHHDVRGPVEIPRKKAHQTHQTPE